MANKYEIVVVFDSELDNTAVNAQIDKIAALVAQHGGEIEKKDFWGRKQLAYPIQKKNYGVYVVLVATGDNSMVADLKRQLRINDQVLRSLVVVKDKFAPDLKRESREEGERGERGGDRFRHGSDQDGQEAGGDAA